MNSNLFESKDFATCKNAEDTAMMLKRATLHGRDIIREQESDKDTLDLKSRIRNGRATKLEQNQYIVMDKIVYYLSQPDDEPLILVYVPSHLKKTVLVQYHDDNGHLGVKMTFHGIKQKYFSLVC